VTDHPFDVLRHELTDAARRQVTMRRPTGRPRRRIALATLGAVLGISAAAWAGGSLLLNGSPVAFRYAAPPSPDRHYGTTVASSIKLLADDVHDPDGGLPWGMRAFTTTRGFGCIQVGRVQEGKLGVLALVRRGSSSLAGRGEFHELRPGVLSQGTTCLPLDGGGHTFVALHLLATTDAVPASCFFGVPGAGAPMCVGHDVRTIDAGLLGPRAESIAFRLDGKARTSRTLGNVGGYLIVQRPVMPVTRSRMFGRRIVKLAAETPIALTPASAVITKVAYRDAQPCEVHATTSPRGACPDPPGFALIPQPTTEAVRTTIHAFAAPNRRGIRLRFRARAAVNDGRSAYSVMITFPGPPCPVQHLPPAERARFAGKTCSAESFGTQLDRNVAAGEQIRTTIDVPNIGRHHRPALRPGVYRVDVSYRVQPPRPRLTGSLAYPGYEVGSTRVVVK
jgi:hypothetical protein